MRKLASIQTVTAINQIEGADFIVAASFEGWVAIVKKSEFSVGDKAVLFEADSVLPEEERYSFLGKAKDIFGKIGYRIRTMKMKGVISQALALPLSLFPEIDQNVEIGEDVSELLNVTKYEIPEHLQKGMTARPAGNFPAEVPKTDQERIQNINKELLEDRTYQVTVKRDGSSATYLIDTEGKFRMASRNLELKYGEEEKSHLWSIVATKYDIENKLRSMIAQVKSIYGIDLPAVAIQGEIFGEGIQSNFENITDGTLHFEIYDMYDIIGQKYIKPNIAKTFTDLADLPHVPVLDYDFKIDNKDKSIDEVRKELVAMAEGTRYNDGKGYREGIVFKDVDSSFSFKAISLTYSLKEK